MGKFGIGARVRDEDGDEGIIVDKRKGERRIRYDRNGLGEIWWPKSDLRATGPQFSEGDRVQLIADNDFGNPFGIDYGKASDAGVIVGFDDFNYTYRVAIDRQDDWWWVKATNLRPFAAVENSETNISGTEGGRQKSWQPKVGDRVRATDFAPTGRIGVIVNRKDNYAGGEWFLCEFDGWTDGHNGYELANGHTKPNRWFMRQRHIEPAPLTIEAGKFYKTRDGQKVGPMRDYEMEDGFPWCDERLIGRFYSDNGEPQNGSDGDHIIAECVDEPAEPKFKVGDKVTTGWGFSYTVVAVNDNDTLDVRDSTQQAPIHRNQRASLFTLAA